MKPLSTAIAPPQGAPRPRRRWRLAAWLLLALCLLALAAAFATVDQIDPAALEVSLNGTPLAADVDFAATPAAHKVVVALCIAVALLLALLVMVGSVVVVLVALVPIVLLAVALPLLAAAVVVLVVFSPLLLLGWLLWRAIRPHSTTMPA